MTFRDTFCSCGTAPLSHDCERICYWSMVSGYANAGVKAHQLERNEGTKDRIADLRFQEAAYGRSQFKTTKRY